MQLVPRERSGGSEHHVLTIGGSRADYACLAPSLTRRGEEAIRESVMVLRRAPPTRVCRPPRRPPRGHGLPRLRPVAAPAGARRRGPVAILAEQAAADAAPGHQAALHEMPVVGGVLRWLGVRLAVSAGPVRRLNAASGEPRRPRRRTRRLPDVTLAQLQPRGPPVGIRWRAAAGVPASPFRATAGAGVLRRSAIPGPRCWRRPEVGRPGDGGRAASGGGPSRVRGRRLRRRR
jgi:hypothetical protein